MSKFCANGHQMEDSWEICPYCAKTGFVGREYAKTRIESEAQVTGRRVVSGAQWRTTGRGLQDSRGPKHCGLISRV